MRVFDVYVAGTALLRGNLFGGIPVASAAPNSRMDEAELQRYLSETPWFPTALLPTAGVTWESIDEHSARATLDDGDVTATAVFHIDEEGYLTRLTTDRYRQDIDAVAPWTGHYRAYEAHDGMQIPTRAEVAWKTADGKVPYWLGTITEIDTGLVERHRSSQPVQKTDVEYSWPPQPVVGQKTQYSSHSSNWVCEDKVEKRRRSGSQ